jgi:hypothetical protein
LSPSSRKKVKKYAKQATETLFVLCCMHLYTLKSGNVMRENSPQKLLQDLIDAEKNNYTEAIKKNQQLEQVKSIPQNKKREKRAEELSEQPSANSATKYFLNDEVNFLQLKQNFISATQEYIATLENLTLEELLNPKTYSKVASLRYHSVL